MRIDLSTLQPGAYAVLRDRATWGFVKRVQANVDPGTGSVKDTTRFADDLLSGLVTEWNVKDENGMLVPVPKDATAEQLDNVAGSIIGRVLEGARDVLAESAPDPNTTPSSSSSPSA